MAPASSTTSLLESLKAIEILKGLILGTGPYLLYDAPSLTYHVDHARAIYGHSYPTSHHTFSVITCVMEWGTMRAPDDDYFAEVIVYTTPDSLVEWKLLITGEESESDLEAMKSLYFTVQRQVGEVSGERKGTMI